MSFPLASKHIFGCTNRRSRRVLTQLFEKILVPLDGSEHSSKALDVAIQIAKKFQGRITLIHVYSVVVTPIVIPEPSTLTTGAPILTGMEFSKLAGAARETGNRILSDARDRAKAEGVETDTVLAEGHAVQEIIRASREGKFDLIVIGARGVSHIREMLLGGVSDAVMHHVVCPVLVVK
jgi:nucleotide-binding universal stress UspA family protein